MPDIGDAYVISVEHAGRTVSALIGPRQVEDWLAHHGAPHVVPGTLRALLHELVREVMTPPPGVYTRELTATETDRDVIHA